MIRNKRLLTVFASIFMLAGCKNSNNVPYIGENGNWWVNGSDTGVKAAGSDGSNGSNGQDGSQGEKGDNGVSVVSVTYKETKDGKDYFTITLSDGSTFDFWTTRGENGSNGQDGSTPSITIGEDGYWYINGTKTNVCAKGQDGNVTEIESIELTDSNGLVDTYTITYSNDGVTSMSFAFSVRNGSSILNGSGSPNSDLGSDGDSYLDTSTGDYYVKSDGKWTYIGNLSSGVPYIGDDGYWYVKDGFTGESTSTGILADGYKEEEYSNRKPSSGLRYVTASEGGVSGYLVSSYNGIDTDVVVPNYIGTVRVIGFDDNAFFGNTNITSVSFSKNTNFVGSKAFYGCTNLTSIDLNDAKVQTIGSSAFYNCTSLAVEIDFGEKLKAIGSSAFYNCSSITSIKLPFTMDSVGEYSFYNNSGATSLTIAEGIKSLGKYCFAGMQKLTSVSVPSSVISIGESAFSGCGNLTDMCLPFVGSSREVASKEASFYASDRNFGYVFGTNTFANARQIRQYYASYTYSSSTQEYSVSDYRRGYAYYYFPANLTNVTILDDSTIDPDAFDGISFLTEINLKNKVHLVDNYAFYGCTSLKNVNFDGGVDKIGSYAFYNNIALENIDLKGTASIGEKAFYNNTSLESVSLSEDIETIEPYAFYGCTGLQSVLNLKFAKTIGSYAFCNAKSLLNYELNAVETIGSYAFCDSAAKQITIKSDTLVSIESYAFSSNASATSITIDCPNLQTIGDYAFQGCTSLTSLIIKDCKADLGKGIFSGDTSLINVGLAEGIKSIGASAFYDCSSLTSVVIPTTVASIGRNAFYGCTNMATMSLPFAGSTSSDTSGLGYLFGSGGDYSNNYRYVPSSLTNLTITKSLNSYGLYGCKYITTLVLGDDVAFTGTYSAYNCSGITTLRIGSSLESIGDYSFALCTALNTLVIPDSVSTLGNHSFDTCSSLTTVTFGTGLTQISAYSFSSCSSLTYVTFAATDGWHLSTSSSGTSVQTLDSKTFEETAMIATYLREKYASYYWCRAMDESE